MLAVIGKLYSVFLKVRKLTSIRIVSERSGSNIHTENSSLKVCLQMAPSFAVEDFPVGQVQDFLH